MDELQTAVDDFLTYLSGERNCSPNTLRSYRAELTVAAASSGRSATTPAAVDSRLLRAYLAERLQRVTRRRPSAAGWRRCGACSGTSAAGDASRRTRPAGSRGRTAGSPCRTC